MGQNIFYNLDINIVLSRDTELWTDPQTVKHCNEQTLTHTFEHNFKLRIDWDEKLSETSHKTHKIEWNVFWINEYFYFFPKNERKNL